MCGVIRISHFSLAHFVSPFRVLRSELAPLAPATDPVAGHGARLWDGEGHGKARDARAARVLLQEGQTLQNRPLVEHGEPKQRVHPAAAKSVHQSDLALVEARSSPRGGVWCWAAERDISLRRLGSHIDLAAFSIDLRCVTAYFLLVFHLLDKGSLFGC